jgi:alkyl hydroperoxide reductase subunit D
MNESTAVIEELLTYAGLPGDYRNDSLTLLENGESRYLRDLKLNMISILVSDHINPKECSLLALSIAINNRNQPLTYFYTKFALEQGATNADLGEVAGCASLLASNNVFYRFRHFVNKEKYGHIPARIRMQLMMKPVTGKEFFELMSLAVSVVNGCEMCVNAHEDSLIKMGTTEERIFDAVRIASLVTSSGKIIY